MLRSWRITNALFGVTLVNVPRNDLVMYLGVATGTHCNAITRAIKLRVGTGGNLVILSIYVPGRELHS